jgi:hypothetical protein
MVSKQSSTLFSDKEQIWADNVSRSPYFGNVYICYAAYRSQELGNALPEPIVLARSTDGGATWSAKQISSATLNGNNPGCDGCAVRTDSNGTVYVFYRGDDPKTKMPSQLMTRSLTGGRTFEPPHAVAGPAETAAVLDPTILRPVMDGIAGARRPGACAERRHRQRRAERRRCDGPDRDGVGRRQPRPERGAGTAVLLARWWHELAERRVDPDREPSLLRRARHRARRLAAVPQLQRVHHQLPVDDGHAPEPDRRAVAHAAERDRRADRLDAGRHRHAGRPAGPASTNDARNAADCPAVDAYRQAYEDGVIAGDPPPQAQEDSPAERDDQDTSGEAAADPAATPPARPSITTQCSPDFGNSDIFGATSAP